MTQTGGLVILYAWLIFAGLLAVLAYLLLRHEQDPLQDLTRRAPTTRTRQDPKRHRPRTQRADQGDALPTAGPLSSQATLTTRPVRGKGTLAPGRSLWLISPADGTRADAVPGCCRGCERSLH